MTILGLEEDLYCVHNPIPVEATGVSGNTVTLQLLDEDDIELLENPPVFYQLNGVAKIDISHWVRHFMPRFRETETYSTTPAIVDNGYIMTVKVRLQDSVETKIVTKRFVHCALQEYVLSDLEDDCCVKVWKCYPFSAPVLGWDERVLLIPDTDIEPDLSICGCVDYDISCCKGVYVKWLNNKGYYSYWLFPGFASLEREGNEIFRIPRSVFDKDRTSNEDTGGFNVTETITVIDKLPKPYWDQLKTLVGSPEVYILSPMWELGSEECTPEDWVRVIPSSPKFERNLKNNSADFEVTLDFPKIYSQKLT